MDAQTKTPLQRGSENIIRRSPRLAAKTRTSSTPRPLLAVQPDFFRYGVCQGLELATFYGKNSAKPMSPTELKDARDVCRFCPVRQACLAQALLDDEPFGIWGGFTKPERDRIVEHYAPKNSHGATAAAAAIPRALAAMYTGELDAKVITLQNAGV